MNRQEMEKLVRVNLIQLTKNYKALFTQVLMAGDNIDLAIAKVMVEKGWAKDTESALELVKAVHSGMDYAENSLNGSLKHLTTGTMEASPALDEMTLSVSSLSGTGQFAELRSALLDLSGESEDSKNLEDSQAFALLPEERQLQILAELYQKVLNRTADLGLSEFNTVVGAEPDAIWGFDSETELVYAVSIANTLKEQGVPMEAHDLYRTAGAYTHTSTYLINKNMEAMRVDPVLSDKAIRIASLIITIAVSAVLLVIVGNAILSVPEIEESIIRATVLGSITKDNMEQLVVPTGNSIEQVLISGTYGSEQYLAAVQGWSDTFLASYTFKKYMPYLVNASELSLILLPIALRPLTEKVLRCVNELLTDRKQQQYYKTHNLDGSVKNEVNDSDDSLVESNFKTHELDILA